LEYIRECEPTPPVVEYEVKIGEVETNVYEEPIKELIIESDSRESTPEYQTVPVKSLINTFEQGKSFVYVNNNTLITSASQFVGFVYFVMKIEEHN
jgi:hypothetical protein